MPLLTSKTALKIVDTVAIVLNQALQLARTRISSAHSPVSRMMAERDHAISETQLLRRELDILRGQRDAMPPHRRPDYAPEHRLAILQLMRMRDWSVAVVAKRFVLHPNTIRSWIKAVEGRGNDRLLAPAVVWNRLDDIVRGAAHELRQLCSEPEFGTRTIARHLVRAGVKVSRSTVQRVLREPKPIKPRPYRPRLFAAGVDPHHLLKPTQSNEVWHLDLTILRVLWFHYTIAAVLDGFTRQLLTLHVYRRTPRTKHVAALMRNTVRVHSKPKFLITDHGPQFRKQFGAAMKAPGIHHVRGRVRHPFLNGKIERLFRSLRIWWRFTLPVLNVNGLQAKLDNFQEWYNVHRIHAALGARTQKEVVEPVVTSKPISIRQCNQRDVRINVTRRACRGDPRLPIIDINIQIRRAV